MISDRGVHSDTSLTDSVRDNFKDYQNTIGKPTKAHYTGQHFGPRDSINCKDSRDIETNERSDGGVVGTELFSMLEKITPL